MNATPNIFYYFNFAIICYPIYLKFIISKIWVLQSQEPVAMTTISLSDDLSLPIQATNNQQRAISTGFRAKGSGSQFCSSVCNLISKSFKLCHSLYDYKYVGRGTTSAMQFGHKGTCPSS
jgi:hypothetical protein